MSVLQSIHLDEDLLKLEPPRAAQGQLQLTNRLEMVRVHDDVLGVVRHLKGIDPGLCMWFDKGQRIFVLLWEGFREKDGRLEWVEDLVGAYRVLDQRIINLVERIDKQGRSRYDLERELDRVDEEARRAKERAFSDQVGERAERLRHALRRDLSAEGSSVQMSTSRGIEKSRREERREARRRAEKKARKAQRR